MIETDSPGISPSVAIQILIVEDEYVIAANLQENLEALGYDVLGIASSATEAIEQAATLSPDLVLMDIRLQGERDGIQAAAAIWSQLQIPVIYVTGHSDQSVLERAKVTSPFGYILKPVRGKELSVAIETALDRYEREQWLATVLKSIGDGMILSDTEGRVLFLNRAAEQLTGWQQEEARERELTEVFNVVYEDTGRSIGNVAVSAIQQDTVIFLNERMLLSAKDGTILPITDSIAPVQNRKGLITGAVLVFRDDTQRRLQEERHWAVRRNQLLERQNEELQRLEQLKDDFLSTVSHELRSPLTNIKMAIQMLQITLDQQDGLATDTPSPPDTERLNRYLTILREQCDQEVALINNLLELQQLEAAARPAVWVSIALHEWLAQGVMAFQERARSHDQQLQLLTPPVLPALVSDPEILTRILTELLMNACKYTPDRGTITVDLEVERKLEPEAAGGQSDETDGSSLVPVVQLRVCNSGTEIPADELTRIFDKFYRIPTSDRWQQGGTGLGLALIKKLVMSLGGAIWAESSTEQTCFIIELPLSPPEA